MAARFHLSIPVRDLEVSRDFYSVKLGCAQGRELKDVWIDFDFYGHQVVCHYAGKDYVPSLHVSGVDGEDVPIPHFGAILSVEQFKELADRLVKSNVEFVIEPHVRYKGQPGEQWTMFFKDPSGNCLEFKSINKPEELFAK